jgi:hypothetical protein
MTANPQDTLRGARPLAAERTTAPMTYEDLLLCSPQASIFATPWWLEAMAPGRHTALELRGADGALTAAWPLVVSHGDDGRRYEMPALTQKLGVLFAPPLGKAVEVQSANQKLVGELIAKLGPYGSFHQNFHETFTDWLPFYWQGFAQTTRYTYVLEDISDLDAIWKGMRPNHRRDIRRAEKLGIRVNDDLSLEAFLGPYHQTFSRQGLAPLATDEVIRRLDAACLAHAGRRIFAGVDAEGRIHAAVYVAWWNGTAYYLMAGSDTELRDSGAQILALWEAIKFAATVARRFDFEGSMLPQVERAFRGFGATQTPYFAISKTPPPPSSLGGYLRYAVDFRLKTLQRRFNR